MVIHWVQMEKSHIVLLLVRLSPPSFGVFEEEVAVVVVVVFVGIAIVVAVVERRKLEAVKLMVE